MLARKSGSTSALLYVTVTATIGRAGLPGKLDHPAALSRR